MPSSDRTFTMADAFDVTEYRQRRLRVNLDAPLPLGHTMAIRRAVQLRALGNHWTYRIIADVMAEYHGFRRSPAYWSKELREAGTERRPRGNGAIHLRKTPREQLFAGGLGGAALHDYLSRED